MKCNGCGQPFRDAQYGEPVCGCAAYDGGGDFCLLVIPRGGEDYWEYLYRVRWSMFEVGEPFGAVELSIGVQNTWIYHPDSPHNRVYEPAAA